MSRLARVPASFFGMVLGLAGLASAWRAGARTLGLPTLPGEAIAGVAIAVWAVLVILFAGKWVAATAEARAETEHPVQCCFIGLAGVATMLVAGLLLPDQRTLALVLFTVGGVFSLGFALWRSGRLWRGGRDPAATTAVLYLPSVAGSFVTATVLGTLGFADWGQLAFGAGFFSWLAIESVLLGRLYTAPELALPLRPTMGIQLAPPAVGAVAYLSVTPGPPDILVHAMLGYALFQTVLIGRLMPWVAQQPFVAGYWAFSFGITALASTALLMAGRGSGPAATLAPALLGFASLVIAGLAIGTIALLLRGRLLPPPAPR